MTIHTNLQLYQAYIIVNQESKPLTLKVAKQFPVMPYSHRWEQSIRGEDAADPICKVLESTIVKDGSSRSWLILVPDYVSGLQWEYPVQNSKDHVWYDELEHIPTVIL